MNLMEDREQAIEKVHGIHRGLQINDITATINNNGTNQVYWFRSCCGGRDFSCSGWYIFKVVQQGAVQQQIVGGFA